MPQTIRSDPQLLWRWSWPAWRSPPSSWRLRPRPPPRAGPGPITQDGSNHVTSDVLPTAQIDGVVWSQAIVGDTVYVGGNFGHARPAGVAAGGAGQVVRTDAMAYSISTGVMTSWAPSLNGQVLAVAVSPDQSTRLPGGPVHDGRRDRPRPDRGIQHVDRCDHLDVRPERRTAESTRSWSRTRRSTPAATSATVSGVARTQTRRVLGLDRRAHWLGPDGRRCRQGDGGHPGRHRDHHRRRVPERQRCRRDRPGRAAWPPTAPRCRGRRATSCRMAGASSGITSLSTDGTAVLRHRVQVRRHASATWKARSRPTPDTGTINWIEDCHGDTYGAFSTGSVVYSVSHSHFCGRRRGVPGDDPDSDCSTALCRGPSMRPARGCTTRSPTTATGAEARRRRSTTGIPTWTPARSPGRPRPPGRSPATASTSCSAGSSPRSTGSPSRAWSASRCLVSPRARTDRA